MNKSKSASHIPFVTPRQNHMRIMTVKVIRVRIEPIMLTRIRIHFRTGNNLGTKMFQHFNIPTPPVMICEGHVARKKATWGHMAKRDSPCGRAWSVPEFLAHMAPCGFVVAPHAFA
jgi:hypothetical protein